MNARLGPALRTAALGAALLALLTLWGGRWWASQAQLVQLVRPEAAATASLFGDGPATPGTPIGQPQRLLIRIPFVSPTIRNFTGLPAPRPEPVSLLLTSLGPSGLCSPFNRSPYDPLIRTLCAERHPEGPCRSCTAAHATRQVRAGAFGSPMTEHGRAPAAAQRARGASVRAGRDGLPVTPPVVARRVRVGRPFPRSEYRYSGEQLTEFRDQALGPRALLLRQGREPGR